MANITKLTNDRTVLIDRLINALEKQVGSSQDALIRSVITDIVEKMDTDDQGRIKNTIANKRLVGLVDNVFTEFAQQHGADIAGGIVDGVQQIAKFNADYFSAFAGKTKLAPANKQVNESLDAWLGISGNKAARNGYLDTVVKDPTVKNKVKDMAMKAVVGQAGYNDTKKAVQDYIAGDPDAQKEGALKKYYRNFVYDMYSQADRTVAKITADKIGMKYAIYEGGIIETSREFCRERNGKVFTVDEIAEFDPPEAKQPDYNPFTDLGGYGCRHHLNYVPEAVAFALRPELRDMKPTPDEVKAVENPPKEEPKPKEEAKPTVTRLPKNAPFADITDFSHTPYPIKKADQQAVNDVARMQAENQAALRKQNDLVAQFNAATKKSTATIDPVKKAAVIAEMEQILADYNAARSAYIDIKTTNDDEIAKINKAFRDRLTKDLTPGNIAVDMDDSMASSKTFTRNMGSAADFFRKLAAGYLEGDTIGVKALKGSRAYSEGNNIVVKKNVDPHTLVHEMAHILEKNTTVLKAAVDFWNKRTAGQPFKSLNKINKAYGVNELYKDGGFPNVYDGKVYGSTAREPGYKNIRATEIISRGLEYMYKDPATFLRKDKDYFNFIYSLFIKR